MVEYKYFLSECIKLFMSDKMLMCADRTVEYYKYSLSIFCEYLCEARGCSLEEIYIDSVTIMDLRGFVSWSLTRDNRNTSGKLTKKSVNTYQVALRSFFRFCYREELMNYDIFSKFKLIKPEKKEKIPLYRDEVEVLDKLLMQEGGELGARNYAMFHLLLDQGMRLSEVVNLKIKDVNFEKRIILIHGKGDKERLMPLTRICARALNTYLLKFRRLSVNYSGSASIGEEAVFLSIRREPITASTIKRLFANLNSRSDIRKVNPHLLRHTFATAFMMQGGGLESLKMLLGHEDVNTTSIYLHLGEKYVVCQADIYMLDPVYFRTIARR